MANDTDEAERGGRIKERSPNFPFIDLETALRRAREFYLQEKRGSAPYSVTVSHWGYAESSSSGQQTVGALRAYGLMEDQGRGQDRRLRLSESALRILLDDRPNSNERDDLIRAAARSPAIYADIYEKWPDEQPSDGNLRHYLLFDRQFGEDAARRVIAILKQNEHLAGVFGYQGASSYPTKELDIIDVSPNETAMDKTSIVPSPGPSRVATNVRIERIIGPDDIDIALQFSADPSRESYEFLRDYIELRLKNMRPKPA